jgi:hypothetical protein
LEKTGGTKPDCVFDTQSTLIVKGIAIILMVCNHLFPIPELIYPENQFLSISVGSKTLAAYVGGFSKICVAIFALLTGIGMFYTYSKKSLRRAYRHTLGKLPHFFLTYWIIIVLIYIPIMSSVGIFTFNLKELILNLFGYQTTYCLAAWYVRFYFEVVLTFPIWVIAYNKLCIILPHKVNKMIPCIFLTIIQWIIAIIIHNVSFPTKEFVSEYFSYIPIIMLGYYIAENNLFGKGADKIKKLDKSKLRCVLTGLFILGCCFIGRGAVKNILCFSLDFFYAPIVIFVSWQLIKIISNQWITKGLIFLGRYSLEIWFLHAIFFIGNPIVQKVGYWPKVSILILIWVFILLIPFAMIIQKVVMLLLSLVRFSKDSNTGSR